MKIQQFINVGLIRSKTFFRVRKQCIIKVILRFKVTSYDNSSAVRGELTLNLLIFIAGKRHQKDHRVVAIHQPQASRMRR